MRDLPSLNEEYHEFIEELKATITEGIFIYRQTLIETNHKIGHLITSQRYASVQQISQDSGISERTLQRCVQFYEKYPDLDKLPEGKAISWHKIVNKYLPEHKEEVVDNSIVCPTCLGKGKVKYEIPKN